MQVKTRLQAANCQHTSSGAVIREVMATGGVLGLWRGTVPSAARAALLTASQCASYDVVKRGILALSHSSNDSFSVQFAAGAVTGVITTTVTSPADVLKTRMFAGGSSCSSASSGAVSKAAPDGVLATCASIVKHEGPTALFKGWTANYARLGPQTMIVFLVAEQLRKVLGLSAL